MKIISREVERVDVVVTEGLMTGWTLAKTRFKVLLDACPTEHVVALRQHGVFLIVVAHCTTQLFFESFKLLFKSRIETG